MLLIKLRIKTGTIAPSAEIVIATGTRRDSRLTGGLVLLLIALMITLHAGARIALETDIGTAIVTTIRTGIAMALAGIWIALGAEIVMMTVVETTIEEATIPGWAVAGEPLALGTVGTMTSEGEVTVTKIDMKGGTTGWTGGAPGMTTPGMTFVAMIEVPLRGQN